MSASSHTPALSERFHRDGLGMNVGVLTRRARQTHPNETYAPGWQGLQRWVKLMDLGGLVRWRTGGVSGRSRLNVGYNAEEDRLRLVCESAAGKQLVLWLTRRFVRRLLDQFGAAVFTGGGAPRPIRRPRPSRVTQYPFARGVAPIHRAGPSLRPAIHVRRRLLVTVAIA